MPKLENTPAPDLIKTENQSDDDLATSPIEEAPADDNVPVQTESSKKKDKTPPTAGLKESAPSQDKLESSPSASQWNSMLYALLLYKAKYGDLNIPVGSEEYADLSAWVKEQRSQYKLYQERGNEDAATDVRNEGILTSDRIAVLDTVGFAWNVRGDVFWQKHYNLLVEYKKENGDVKVPRLFTKNPKLGEWVTDQRRQLKAKLDGRPSMMTDERKEKLDALGFLWKVRERADWNDRYEQLLEYKKENGHCVVPQHYQENRALGKWVAKQREQYRFYHAGKHSFLTEERIDLLKSLGFVWRVKGKGKGDALYDGLDNVGDTVDAMIQIKSEGGANVAEEGGPMKKRKKIISQNHGRKAKAKKEEVESSDIDDDDDDDEEEIVQMNDEVEVTNADDLTSAAKAAGGFSSMNGMGLLASMTDGVPSLPSLPADQQLLFAEQQHAMRASMLENFAARANHRMDFSQQRSVTSSQTMADIAAALARQSRFGAGFAGAAGMGMFANMNMQGMGMQTGVYGMSGMQMPAMSGMHGNSPPGDGPNSEENNSRMV